MKMGWIQAYQRYLHFPYYKSDDISPDAPMYTRRAHFYFMMQRYQGFPPPKETIPLAVFKRIENQWYRHSQNEMTKDVIIRCLRELRLNKYWDYADFFYYCFTGTRQDLTDLEMRLMKDFDEYNASQNPLHIHYETLLLQIRV
jgi:hypothetical protein